MEKPKAIVKKKFIRWLFSILYLWNDKHTRDRTSLRYSRRGLLYRDSIMDLQFSLAGFSRARDTGRRQTVPAAVASVELEAPETRGPRASIRSDRGRPSPRRDTPKNYDYLERQHRYLWNGGEHRRFSPGSRSHSACHSMDRAVPRTSNPERWINFNNRKFFYQSNILI